MSSMMAIAAVSAALKDYLENRLAQFATKDAISYAKVTLIAPDRITLGAEEPNQINLFLYRVAPNASLRNSSRTVTAPTLASTSKAGKVTGKPNPSVSGMALDLFYLLTVYGSEPLSCEALLGCAAGALHEATPDTLRAALQTVTQDDQSHSNEVHGQAAKRIRLPVSAIDRFDLKVTPQFLSMDEMSKLWSSLQAKYRLSLAYQVSGVMIGESVGESA